MKMNKKKSGVSLEDSRKPKEIPKVNIWEKARRDKMKLYFQELMEVLPMYDPAAPMSRFEVLTKATSFIQDLQAQNQDLINGGFDEVYREKMTRLKNRIKELLQRVDQLTDLLRVANISVPPSCPCPKPESGKGTNWLDERPKKWTEKLNVVVPKEKIDSVLFLIKDSKKKNGKSVPRKETVKKVVRKKKKEIISKENNPVDFNLQEEGKKTEVCKSDVVTPVFSNVTPGAGGSTFLLTNGSLVPILNTNASVFNPSLGSVLINRPAPVIVMQKPAAPVIQTAQIVAVPSSVQVLNTTPTPQVATSTKSLPYVLAKPPANKRRILRDSTVTTFVNKIPIPALSKQSYTKRPIVTTKTKKKDDKKTAAKVDSAIQVSEENPVDPPKETSKESPITKKPKLNSEVFKPIQSPDILNLPPLHPSLSVSPTAAFLSTFPIVATTKYDTDEETPMKSSKPEEKEKSENPEKQKSPQNNEKEWGPFPLEAPPPTNLTANFTVTTPTSTYKNNLANMVKSTASSGQLQKKETLTSNQNVPTAKYKLLPANQAISIKQNPVALKNPKVVASDISAPTNVDIGSTIAQGLTIAPSVSGSPGFSATQGQSLSVAPSFSVAQGQSLSVAPSFSVTQGQGLSVAPSFSVAEGQSLSVAPSFSVAQAHSLSVAPNFNVSQKESLNAPLSFSISQGPSLRVAPSLNLSQNNNLSIVSSFNVAQSQALSVPPSFNASQAQSLGITPSFSVAQVQGPSNAPPLSSSQSQALGIASAQGQRPSIVPALSSSQGQALGIPCAQSQGPSIVPALSSSQGQALGISCAQNQGPSIVPALSSSQGQALGIPCAQSQGPSIVPSLSSSQGQALGIACVSRGQVSSDTSNFRAQDQVLRVAPSFNASQGHGLNAAPSFSSSQDSTGHHFSLTQNQISSSVPALSFASNQVQNQVAAPSFTASRSQSLTSVAQVSSATQTLGVSKPPMLQSSVAKGVASKGVNAGVSPLVPQGMTVGQGQPCPPSGFSGTQALQQRSIRPPVNWMTDNSFYQQSQMMKPNEYLPDTFTTCKVDKKDKKVEKCTYKPSQNYNIFDYNYNSYAEEESKFCNYEGKNKKMPAVVRKKSEHTVHHLGVGETTDVKKPLEQYNSDCFSWAPSKSMDWLPNKCSFGVDTNLVVPCTLPTLVGDLALGTNTTTDILHPVKNKPLKTIEPEPIMENKQFLEPFTNLSKNIFDVTNPVEKQSFSNHETIVLKNIFDLPTPQRKQRSLPQTQNSFLSVSQLVENQNFETLKQDHADAKVDQYYYQSKQYKNKRNYKCERKYNPGYKNTNYTAEALIRSSTQEFSSDQNFFHQKNQKPENFSNEINSGVFPDLNFSNPMTNFNIPTTTDGSYDNFSIQNNSFLSDFAPDYQLADNVSNSLLLPPCSIGFQNPFIVNVDKKTTQEKPIKKHCSRSRKTFDCSKIPDATIICPPIFTTTSTCQNTSEVVPFPNFTPNASLHKFPSPTSFIRAPSSAANVVPSFSVGNTATFPSSTQSNLPFLSLPNHNVIMPSAPSTTGSSLANFNLSTIFPEINQKGNYQYT